MLAKIIIIIVPIIAYIIMLLWTNRLITSKLIHKGDRNKYKKFHNPHLAKIFAPLFLCSSLIIGSLYPQPTKWIIYDQFMLTVRIITLILSTILAIMIYKKMKIQIHKLKTDTPENIMKSIQTT